MAKILTDLEVIDIVARAPEEIDDAEQYERFIADIARVVTDHFGGEVGTVERVAPGFFTSPQHDDGPAPKQHFVATSPRCEPTVSVAIHPDESVPAGGCIWIGYDPDADSEFNGAEGAEASASPGAATHTRPGDSTAPEETRP